MLKDVNKDGYPEMLVTILVQPLKAKCDISSQRAAAVQ